MTQQTRQFRIGTRGSKLALWQADHVAALVQRAFPTVKVSVHVVKTTGDKIRDVALSKIGDTSLFTKEIERALEADEVDCCVHSMKDVPTRLPDNMEIAAVLERADVRDALVAAPGMTLETLPEGSRVGTGSLRRRAQLAALRPDLELVELRGNLDTRLARVEDGTLDAAVLACAGIDRIGGEERIAQRIPAHVMTPAAGQGAIGVEVRHDDKHARAICAAIAHEKTALCVGCERAVMRGLDGGCQVPIGAWARIEGNQLTLDAMVATLDGSHVLRTSQSGNPCEPERVAQSVLSDLRAQGADALLASARSAVTPPSPDRPVF